jgi:lipopolysaccharide transport system ATP-binding protein
MKVFTLWSLKRILWRQNGKDGMEDPAIRVENLGKEYQLGVREQYTTLRETIMNAAIGPFRRIAHLSGKGIDAERIWALKDVSFEVEPGEVVGVIGRNGAGKTTLLKILTRITEPTTGRAEVRGHVGSLLEVGTGMHPELTGRENIFLNGAVLGMSHATVKRVFDEIVDFSGVERFLDTPVKRYSSGMRVRLAFAVAAHLEPEILLVDEVLAVGDVEFQKKCLGKMHNVAHAGRTVLFVSHDLAAVTSICESSIVLHNGQVDFIGPVCVGIARYLEKLSDAARVSLADRKDRSGNGALRFIECRIVDMEEKEIAEVETGMSFKLLADYEAREHLDHVNAGIAIKSSRNVRLSSVSSSLLKSPQRKIPKRGVFEFVIKRLPFNVGEYSILLDANIDGEVLDRVESALTFSVRPGNFYPGGALPHPKNTYLLDFEIGVRSR